MVRRGRGRAPADPRVARRLRVPRQSLALAAYAGDPRRGGGGEAALRRHAHRRRGRDPAPGGSRRRRRRSRTGRATAAIPESFQLVQLEFGGVAEFLARIAGAQGPCYTLSTACSASAKALVSARALLELDVCDAVDRRWRGLLVPAHRQRLRLAAGGREGPHESDEPQPQRDHARARGPRSSW